MFCLTATIAQEDRFKHFKEAKSCLTLDSLHSDNVSLRSRRRRKSFCGLQLDGFFGALLSSSRANTELIDASWSGRNFPRVADQTDLPDIAGLCVQPCFSIRKHQAPRLHFAQSSCCLTFASSVFTGTDRDRYLIQSEFRRTLTQFEKLS